MGDIQLNPGPTENYCHVYSKEMDTQHGLQCDTCDVWLHPSCVNANQPELRAFETDDIPFMCSRCEWEENEKIISIT